MGRVSQVDTTISGNPKTLASNITSLPFGGITGLTYGNGLALSQGYDNQYRISSILVGSLINLTYSYDPNGNIISIVDSVNPPEDQPIDDPAGYTYLQGTNKLTHLSGANPANFGYDANGNITSENTWTYVYDLSNQLIRVLDGTNQIAEYVYNGAGQRMKKITQTETRIFHYDLQGHLIAESNQSGQMIAEYVYLRDQLLAMIKPGELVYYFHNDHLGTPQDLSDETQVIAWKAAYTPFGQAAISVEITENPFRFPGQYYDTETGLHYNYFRYYDPTTGRYVTPDPIGLEGGINLFGYVQNNPLRFIDPLGLYCVYHQSTGQMTCFNDQTGEQYYNEKGYSGRNEGSKKGRNNPAMQDVKNIGPIQRGPWWWGQPYKDPDMGPDTVPLVPAPGNTCFGSPRDCYSFYSHGDNAEGNASKGCLILPKNRTKIPRGEKIYVVP